MLTTSSTMIMTSKTHKVLAIDLETYSSVDLTAVSVYKYTESPDFEILLFAYAWDDEPVRIVDFTRGEALPPDVKAALTDTAITKAAFNASFERVCLSRYLGKRLAPQGWDCTRVRALTAGLPGSLKGAGEALDIEKAKMDEGSALIRKFCKPCPRTGKRARPEDAPQDWETFKKYCRRDVEAERKIRERLSYITYTADEYKLYCADQDINDRGVQIDLDLVQAAIYADEESVARTMEKAKRLSGLENPRSVMQLKGWLKKRLGQEPKSLSKSTVADMLKADPPEDVRDVLSCRMLMGKTSVAKYKKMLNVAGKDGRARGLFQFYGASRTGRWAGRLIQLQNLAKNHTEPLSVLRDLVKARQIDAVSDWFMPIPYALSQLVRTALIASPGNVITVSDFSAIEARVIAWLAGESWRQKVFATTGKIYEASAAQMFHVPAESITKSDPRRQKGKVAELACGYGGGVGALKAMGADKMGLTDEELQDIITRWRAKSPRIVRLWGALEDGAKMAIETKSTVRIRQGVTIKATDDYMAIQLPSGRSIYYAYPAIEPIEKFGRLVSSITYMGVDQTTRKWKRLETYGGKLTENVVQAIARDCLGVTICRLEALGYHIVAHIHDEVLIDGPRGILENVNAVMATPIPWAPGLLLKGAGYETEFYRKD
nr:MAG TPA: DNA polymerase I [Caudoviricetes sp.]